jgi:hypothetical protein
MISVTAPLPPQAPRTLDDLTAGARHYAFYFLKLHGNIRPGVMPSEDPNRKELVCLLQQTRDTCTSTFLNIVRLDDPKREFFNLTDNTDMGRMESVPREQSDSRFDWLLPAAEPPPDIRAAARVWLELQGVDLKKLILKPHGRRR